MFTSGWPLMPGSYLYPRPHPSGPEGGCEGPEVMAGHLPAGACHSWEFSGDPDGGTCCPWAPPATHCWFQSPGALLGAPVTAPLVLPPSLDIQPGQGSWLWGLLPAEVQGERRPRGHKAGCGQACAFSSLGAAGGISGSGPPIPSLYQLFPNLLQRDPPFLHLQQVHFRPHTGSRQSSGA